MQFYCPVCQHIQELDPETTITTKLNQQAFKAHCPTCQQDLACYGIPSEHTESPPVQTVIPDADAQAAVDQALKDFGSTVN